jgi:hypothetical protein
MTKSPTDPKNPVPKRKRRTGYDFVFRVPKGVYVSDADAKRYFDGDDKQPGQWYGKGASLLEQGAVRKTTGAELIPASFRHRVVPAGPIDPPRHHLWVNGVEITDELGERLLRMTEEEYEQFWEEALKAQKWEAAAKNGTRRRIRKSKPTSSNTVARAVHPNPRES